MPATPISVCPCCGTPTRRLFAPGHDARYKGQLARAVAAAGGDFDAPAVLTFYIGPDSGLLVSAAEAITRVDTVLHSDWRTKIDKSVGRLLSTPVRSPARPREPRPPRTSPSSRTSSREANAAPPRTALGSPELGSAKSFDDQDTSDARRERYLADRERDARDRARADSLVESLMERLNAHPKAGQWGWYRPGAPTEAERTVRYPAQVRKTYRSEGIFGIDLLTVHPDGHRELVLDVLPSLWVRDPDAKS